MPLVFAGIAVSLAVSYFVEPTGCSPCRSGRGWWCATLLAFIPIYLANVAFSKRFGASEDSRSAFGLNLLGAMLGGCMEYLALLTGYRNLLILVAALYLVRLPAHPARAW
ncbi:MAG: hypothetical protein U0R72_11775 [Nakamurella multipartita]